MKRIPSTNYESRVSDFTRKMWEVEAAHPVFAGSLNNIRLLVTVDQKPSPGKSPRAKNAASRSGPVNHRKSEKSN